MGIEDFSKVIITGGDGIIGSYFDFGQRLSRSDLDITDERKVSAIFKKFQPEAAIHLAAATDVERCEKDPEYAWRVNVWGTFNIVKACREYGAKMVYVSTAVVFSGNEPSHAEVDIPFPRNVYGRTKYAGEMLVQDLAPSHLILRTSWVFGGGPERDHKFVGKIIKQLKDGATVIKAVNDQLGSTTFAKDFVGCVKSLLLEGQTGILHVVNSGQTSRYGMAKEIVSTFGKIADVEPTSYRDFGLRADRMSSEALSSASSSLRPWQDALKEYLETEWRQFLNNK